MVIYEVNLVIDSDIYSQFQLWLKEHVREMLQFNGFIQANILKPTNEDTESQRKITVQYKVDTLNSLNNYFNNFASAMREEGIKLFKNKFSAQRRIYESNECITK